MARQFQKHYTREEANALLPRIRGWMEKIKGVQQELARCDARLEALRVDLVDLGGETANRQVRLLAQLRELLAEFEQRQIQVKDFERGLMDFPAIIGDREVFLCWELDEESVEHWHSLEGGFAGRERL